MVGGWLGAMKAVQQKGQLRSSICRKPGTATLLFKYLQHVMYNMKSDEYIQEYAISEPLVL